MSDSGTHSPAGWYPDPAGGPGARYWDGATWTTHTTVPQHAPVVLPPPPLRAPAGTSWNTPWIWVVVLVPLLSLVFLLLFPWQAFLDDYTQQISGLGRRGMTYFSPGREYLWWSLASYALSFVIWAVVIVAALLDYRALRARGVPQPFHWVWALLGAVYPIGRSIVVRRRTGHGYVPMIVEFVPLGVSIIAAFGFMFWITNEIFTATFEMLPYLERNIR